MSNGVVAVNLEDLGPQFKSHIPEKSDDLIYDLGNLTAFDQHDLDRKRVKSDISGYLKELNRDNTQFLLNRVFALPSTAADVGRVCELPEPTTVLPREKPAPKPSELTRWEAFAKERGINKKKKERMVWDEQHQEYRPSWGYKRANDDTKDWLIEHKDGDDYTVDPFKAREQVKKEKVNKQKKKELKNLERTGQVAPGNLGVAVKDKARKEEIEGALAYTHGSTASMGKFDQLRADEPDPNKGKKRKFNATIGDSKEERQKSLAILNKLDGGKVSFDKEKAARKAKTEEEKKMALNKKKGVLKKGSRKRR